MTAPPVHDAEFFALQRALAGEYSLERELGRGGMGVVYLAREVQLERLVAIKVLNPMHALDAESRERFLREARTAANLSHPNIVPIHRVGESAGFVFFVMAYIDGETLGNRIRERGPLAANAAARLLRETAWALGHAHDHAVVHRDVKPDNILLERDSGRAVVTDFGIARVGPAEEGPDAARVMGTAHFMSPEQGRGGPVDARSDLYALGVVGHYALTGRVPFDGVNSSAIIAQHQHAPVPVLTETPSIPRMLAEAVERCLRKDPTSRFANAKELADALDADAMSRLELPAPIRSWLQTQNPLRGVLTAWLIMGGFGLLVTLMGRSGGGGNVVATAAVTAVPLLTLFGFHLSQTRRTLVAGYSRSDLLLALERWRAARREELIFAAGDIPRWMRIVRGATWSALGLFLLSGLAVTVTHRTSSIATAVLDRMWYLGLAAGISFLASNALGVPLIGRPKGVMLDGALRKWFWGSRLGAWMARQLARGRSTPMHLMNRPTEAALSMAAIELFESLPKAYRRELGDVPTVVRRLEARAGEMRRYIEDLGALLARAERDASLEEVTQERAVRSQLVESRDRAKGELASTVAALETIRLGLLKLRGGADVANTITELVEQAQSAAGDLDRLAAAKAELDVAFPMDATSG